MQPETLNQIWVRQAQLDAERGVIECRVCRKRMGLDYLEIWIDRKNHLPVKVVGVNKKDKITKTVRFKNMATDKKGTGGDFRMRRPSSGWQTLPDKRLSGAGAIKP